MFQNKGIDLNTVIFGGAGFIGLNVTEYLLERGSAVTVFDAGDMAVEARHYLSSLPGTLSVIKGSTQDPEAINLAFQQPVDGVIFGAAITAGATRDAADPEQIIDVNLTGFIRVLRAAQAAGVKRVINLSSASAYGNAAFSDQPLNEETTIADPVSLYALTKFSSERAAIRLGELWNMDIRSVRLSGIYGRWEQITSARDTPSPHFQIMRQALSGKPALFARHDQRDWVYAPNIAHLIVTILDTPKLNFSLYNLSSGLVESAYEWGRQLANFSRGFECRLIEEGETPTIDLHSSKDRQRLDIARLAADTNFAPPFRTQQTVEDYYTWAGSNGWAF